MYRYQYTKKEKAIMYIKADLSRQGLSYEDVAKMIRSRPTFVARAFETLHLTNSLIVKLNQTFRYSAEFMLNFNGPMYVDKETPELVVDFPSKTPNLLESVKTVDVQDIEGGQDFAQQLSSLFFDFIKLLNAEYYLCSLSASYKNDEFKIYVNKHYYKPWPISEEDKAQCSCTVQKESIKEAKINNGMPCCHNCGNEDKFIAFPKKNIFFCCKCGSQIKTGVSSKVITFSYNENNEQNEK